MRNGEFDVVTDTVETLTGHAAQTLDAFLAPPSPVMGTLARPLNPFCEPDLTTREKCRDRSGARTQAASFGLVATRPVPPPRDCPRTSSPTNEPHRPRRPVVGLRRYLRPTAITVKTTTATRSAPASPVRARAAQSIRNANSW